MKQGTGLVSIHFSTWINNELGGKYWLDWLGGVANWGQDDSKVLVTKWSAAPIKSEHPILRGITPWVYEQEEFFFKETMPPDPRRTPGAPAFVRLSTGKGLELRGLISIICRE